MCVLFLVLLAAGAPAGLDVCCFCLRLECQVACMLFLPAGALACLQVFCSLFAAGAPPCLCMCVCVCAWVWVRVFFRSASMLESFSVVCRWSASVPLSALHVCFVRVCVCDYFYFLPAAGAPACLCDMCVKFFRTVGAPCFLFLHASARRRSASMPACLVLFLFATVAPACLFVSFLLCCRGCCCCWLLGCPCRACCCRLLGC